jgi:dihydroorotate dehydrogenase (NAD+) catalytic subunit
MRYDVPVVAKLAPDVADIVSVARACVDAGADALSMINNPLGMAIDTEALRPSLAAVTGGLSGPAILPLAVRCVWQVHAALPGVPLIGVGGVMTGRDAFQLVLAGACAVGVGTALFHDPYACLRIERELEELLRARGFQRLADAVGLAHRPPGSAPRHLLVDTEESTP